MGDDISTFARVVITMCIVVAIVIVVLSVAAISFNFSRQVQHNMANQAAILNSVSVSDLSNYSKDLPGSVIYLALGRSEDVVAQFTMEVDGKTYTNLDDMQQFLGERFYVQTQYSNGFYAVNVVSSM